MKRFAVLFSMFAALAFLAVAQAQQPTADELQKQRDAIAAKLAEAVKKGKPRIASDKGTPDPKLPRGLNKTPIAKILEAVRTGKCGVHHATRDLLPANVTMVPGKLSYLGNDRYGCCVTSESCFSMEAYSVYLGLPQIVITDAACIAWAQAHGVLNGANLMDVMDGMAQDGIKDSTGKLYKSGPYSTVDFSNEANLQSAIAIGPVSIGIDSSALPSGAGNANGWFSFGGSPGQFRNEDHNTDICGYGDAKTLFAALGKPVPAGAPAGTLYLQYTWSTIGVVDHDWIMSAVGSAFVRKPTVVGLAPTPPPPPPPPPPGQITVAIPNGTAQAGTPYTVAPVVTGATAPLTWSFSWGDGSASQTPTHVYAGAGAFTMAATVIDAKGLLGSGQATVTVGAGPVPPIPGNQPTFEIKGIGPTVDGTYYMLKTEIGNMRLIDVLQPKK